MRALEVKNLSVYFQSPEPVLDNISFSADASEIVTVIGPNGSGKTTLFRAILGLIPAQGEVKVFGRTAAESFLYIGYLPQRFVFDASIPVTVEEVVKMPLTMCKSDPIQKKEYVEKALDRVGMRAEMGRLFNELSGGQLQRVLLARALVHHPKLLLLDEPESGIDVGGEINIYHLLKKLAAEEKLTILINSHEIDIVLGYADKVICLNKKMVCYGPPRRAITQQVLEELYGQHIGIFQRTKAKHGH